VLNQQEKPNAGFISSQLFNDLIVFVLHFLIVNHSSALLNRNKQIENNLKELSESKNKLQAAYDKLEQATVIEERNRIAHDIHDIAGHSITTVIMQTEAAKLVIDTQPEEAKKKLIAANLQAKIALEELRQSVHYLSGRKANQTLKIILKTL
jgi:signal transduction histidine kinase